jgi:hypothetical protein
MNVTTIGPLTYETRDKLREFKDQRDLNYNEAIQTLLEEAEA